MMNSVVQKYIDEIRQFSQRIKPLVVVRCITYNHVAYIRDALESFVAQQTEFPFIVIVHDDASTDGTQEIIKEYADKYPNIIKPIFEEENQYNKGNGEFGNIVDTACRVTGAKYIAVCEGDDYWIDPLKLQIQVNYLESHPQILYTCHRYLEQDSDSNIAKLVRNKYLDRYPEKIGFEFDKDYAFNYDWVPKTLTSLYRMECLKGNELKKCIMYRDTHLIHHILTQGNGYCFQFKGGVYRKQNTGVWSQLDNVSKYKQEVLKWEEIYKVQPTKFNLSQFKKFFSIYFVASIKYRKIPVVKTILQFRSLFLIPITLIKFKRNLKSESQIQRINRMNNVS